MQNYVTTASAAKLVGLSRSFLFRNACRIPAARRAGRALRWDVEELRHWMAEQAREPSEKVVDRKTVGANDAH
jgi:predicted DNA-binding transcriptional regulator AlpA